MVTKVAKMSICFCWVLKLMRLRKSEFFENNSFKRERSVNEKNTKKEGSVNISTKPYIHTRNNPLPRIVIPFIVCCLAIDGSIYAYFKFVKGQTFIEGIRTWQSNVRTFFSSPEKPKHIIEVFPKRIIVSNPDPIEQYPSPHPVYPPKFDNTPYRYQQSQGKRQNTDKNIYTWKDDNGNIHSSNVGIPQSKTVNDLSVNKELNSYEKETPVIVKGNSVYIPVLLNHGGRVIGTNLLVDTGASRTHIKSSDMQVIKGDYIRKSTAIVADGRRVKTYHRKIDSIKVGPFKEVSFVVSSFRTNKPDTGLLGMDFFKKHPFTIDYRRKVLIWQ